MIDASPSRRALLVGAAVAGGLAYGYLIAHIPSPRDAGVFWVSNLSAPWLALAFLAGWPQRSRPWGALAGCCADVACVVGFYAQFFTFGDSGRLGLWPTTPLAQRLAADLGGWVSFAAPWLLAGVLAGAVFGCLGACWGKSRSPVAGLVLAAAFVFESAAWFLHNHALWPPHSIWIAEVCFGVLLLAWVVAATQRRRRAT
jgi:hypothetical protein